MLWTSSSSRSSFAWKQSSRRKRAERLQKITREHPKARWIMSSRWRNILQIFRGRRTSSATKNLIRRSSRRSFRKTMSCRSSRRRGTNWWNRYRRASICGMNCSLNTESNQKSTRSKWISSNPSKSRRSSPQKRRSQKHRENKIYWSKLQIIQAKNEEERNWRARVRGTEAIRRRVKRRTIRRWRRRSTFPIRRRRKPRLMTSSIDKDCTI